MASASIRSINIALALTSLTLCSSGAYSQNTPVAEIGVATEVSGQVKIFRDGSVLESDQAFLISEGDRISVRENSSAQIEMRDGEIYVLGPSAEITIKEYDISQSNAPSAEKDIIITSGSMRFHAPTKTFAGRQRYTTPLATIRADDADGIISATPSSTDVFIIIGKATVDEHLPSGESGERIELDAGWRLTKDGDRPSVASRKTLGDLAADAPQMVTKNIPINNWQAADKFIRKADADDYDHLLRLNPAVSKYFLRMKMRESRKNMKADPRSARIDTIDRSKPFRLPGEMYIDADGLAEEMLREREKQN